MGNKNIKLTPEMEEVRDLIDGIRELRGQEPLYSKDESEKWSFSDYYWKNREKELKRKKEYREKKKLQKVRVQCD